MSDTDGMRTYRPNAAPQGDADHWKYLYRELQSISQTLVTVKEILAKLEARLVTGGL